LVFIAPPAAFAEGPPITMELNYFGQPVLYRYGEKQSFFFYTGTGLPEIFKGVPEAEYLAGRYQLFATLGHGLSFVGSAAVGAGIYYRLSKEYKRADHPLSWYIILGGGALSAGGTVVAVLSQRLIYQAVNVFNERVQPEMLPEFHMHTADGGQPEYRVLWSINR
jgi:hypothetical protein